MAADFPITYPWVTKTSDYTDTLYYHWHPFGIRVYDDIPYYTGELCPPGRDLAAVTSKKKPFYFLDRVYKNGIRKLGYTDKEKDDIAALADPFDDLIWTIRPDGSATYTRKLIPTLVQVFTGGSESGFCQSYDKWTEAKPIPGFASGTYEFSPEGLKLFRKVASLFPRGFMDRSRYNEFPLWPAWVFPFEKDDSKEVKAWIASMHPADVLALYYTLIEYNGEDQNIYGGSSFCKTRKWVSAVTPEEFKNNGFWSPYQEMLIQAIWDIRTDLRKVKDPKTGEIVDGIMDFKLFQQPCRQGSRGMIAEIVGGIAVGLMTFGASAAFKASLTAINAAKTAVNVADQQQKMLAMRDFASKVVIGYQAAADPSNVIKPLNFTQRDLSSDPTSYDAQPVDEQNVSIGLLVGIAIGGYYLLS